MPTVSAELGGFVAPGWGEDRRLLFDVRGTLSRGGAANIASPSGCGRRKLAP